MNDALTLTSTLGDILFGLLLGLTALLTLVASALFRRAAWSARIAAALSSSLVCGAVITGAAHFGMRSLGEPRLDIERVDATTFTSLRRWSTSQRRALVLASLSPAHRRAVKRRLDRAMRVTSPFPPADDAEAARLRAWLLTSGDCARVAQLDRRLGDFQRAAASQCARPGAARYAAEAALAMGDADRAWRILAPTRSDVRDGFDGRLLTLLEHPPPAALAELPAVAAHERAMWGCVMERLRQRNLDGLDPSAWTPMLASDSAACRILAATAPGQRDPQSLRALTRLPVPAVRAWSATLTAARVLLTIEADPQPTPCLSRRIAAIGPVWLSRYPSLAETLLRDLDREGCALVMDRVWFPAMQARAWSEWGDPERPSVEAFEDLIVGWQLVDGAWDRMHTLSDSRFTRGRRAQLGRSFRGALGPLTDYTVGRLDVAWADGTAWPRGFSWASVLVTLDGLPRRDGWPHESMRRAHGIPRYAIDTAKRWELDVVRAPSHNAVLSAWIDYWRTGTFAPAREAPSWVRDDGMLRVVAAVEGDASEVMHALDAPTIQHAERLAVVAYRLHGDAGRLEAWLRRAWGSIDPLAGTLADWEAWLQTLRTCALRLRLPALRRDLEASLMAVRRMRRQSDAFVQAVLDGPRPQPPPEDDDGD